ncbi:MAG: GNAT family N-acetyltransferase [Phycisphaerales bacterium]|nr:GNAT family N-acetyltransferase [Phycisphaerales bacterium]MCB9836727.1 GNAT family N-acetyltransferase [Phycisphaera sp.]
MILNSVLRHEHHACSPATDASLSLITIDDQPLFAAAMASLSEPISDTSFTASLCWSEALQLRKAIVEGHLCLFSAADGDLSMMLPPLPLSPTEAWRLPDAVEACFAIMDEANAEGPGVNRSRIEYVSEEMAGRIQGTTWMELVQEPMHGDYVYPRDDLVELAGGDLKGKRKLRSKFMRENPDITTGPIRREDIPECIRLLAHWREAADIRHEGEANERLMGVDILRQRDEQSTIRFLELIEPLGLESMTVRVAGRLVGFTIGEWLTPTMGLVCVEKTEPGLAGAPQFIYSEFCRTSFAGATEINAGDDWGIASLRYTKTSYRPSRMLAKYTIARRPRPETGSPETTIVRTLTQRRKVSPAAEVTMQPNMTVRRATTEDASSIIAVENLAFTDESDRFSLGQIRRLIANPRARVGVAEVDGVISGWCVGLIRTHLRWRSGRVYTVAVSPEMAGKGLGRALLNWSLDTLEAEGVRRVYLEVRQSNQSAINLYASAGFIKIADLPAYYGPNADGIRMRRVAAEPVA